MSETVETVKREREISLFKDTLVHTLMKIGVREKKEIYYVLAKSLSELGVAVVDKPVFAYLGDNRVVLGRTFFEALEKMKERDRVDLTSFVFLHEALHYIYGHDARIKLADDPELYNIVADLFVNTSLSQLGFKPPGRTVTLGTFIDFILNKYGDRIPREVLEELERIGRGVVVNNLSVEQAYNIISRIPRDVLREIVSTMFSGAFYGKDLERESGGGGGGGGEECEAGGESKGGKEIDVSETASSGKKTIDKLNSISEKLSKRMEIVNRSIGEYSAFLKHTGIKPGESSGVIGEAEYSQMKALAMPLMKIFLLNIGDTYTEPSIHFEELNEEAYWVPPRIKEKRRRVYCLLDTSPSVPLEHIEVFLACVNGAMTIYDVEYRLVVFGTGVLETMNLSPEDFRGKLPRIPLGAGTVWDNTVASEIRNCVAENVKVIQVLSDFYIEVEDSAREAIRAFKLNGGVVACYSSTGVFLDFCDFKVKLPIIPRRHG